jgi:hypothetical protein
MTGSGDNDTPAQSQSERDKTVAGNEGGSAECRSGETPVERVSNPPFDVLESKSNKIAGLIRSSARLYSGFAARKYETSNINPNVKEWRLLQ